MLILYIIKLQLGPIDPFSSRSHIIYVCCYWFWCSDTGKRFSNRIETSCLPLLNAAFEAATYKTPNRQQTVCPHTNRLSYRGSNKKLELNFPSLSWVDIIQPTLFHCRSAFVSGSGDMHVYCWFWCSGTNKRFSNRKEKSCIPLLNSVFEAGKSEIPNRQHTECPLTNRLGYRGSSQNMPTFDANSWFHTKMMPNKRFL